MGNKGAANRAFGGASPERLAELKKKINDPVYMNNIVFALADRMAQKFVEDKMIDTGIGNTGGTAIKLTSEAFLTTDVPDGVTAVQTVLYFHCPEGVDVHDFQNQVAACIKGADVKHNLLKESRLVTFVSTTAHKTKRT